MFFKWSQLRGGEESWSLILADQEARHIKEKAPAFTTILAADTDFKAEGMTAEDMAKVHYLGDWYLDFDATSIEEVIPQYQKFLTKLKDEYSFDLQQASLYASGGKGFHIIIPMQCLVPKVKPLGVLGLPHIFKEMAVETFVDCVDLRVYTARRGRMFRTANVERPDKPGVHKVPLTVEESFSITPEIYRTLCSAPRHVAAPAPAEFNPQLGLLYSSAYLKVEKALKNRKKGKADAKLIQKFGGEVPVSIQTLMRGECLLEGVGFQKIATQLALTAHALAKTADQFVAMCAGLIENHVSDGNRYNTPAKRRVELIRMFNYMAENPCYEFSIGGVKSLMSKEFKTPDLDNGGVEMDNEEADNELESSISQGIKISAQGIYKRTDEGLAKICAVGLANPRQLVNTDNEDILGYEVDVFVDGKPRGSRVLDMGKFGSRAKFQAFTLSTGGASMSGNDNQVGAIADILRMRTAKTGEQVYTTSAEGLDVITFPNGERDVVWADRHRVLSNMGIKYRLVGALTSDGEYGTDLEMSPELEDTAESREFFTQLFQINQPDVIAKLFGWYLAAFLTQPIRVEYNQFPSLQVFGPAGSGKSKSNELFAKLHYWRRQPRMPSAIAATPFALEAFAAGSASIPFVIDEFKPREMRRDRLDRLTSIIRDNYTGLAITKGRLSTDTGESKLDLRKSRNQAPLATIGEAIFEQDAILQRVILVPLTKDGKRGHSEAFRYCMLHREEMSRLGRSCLTRILGVNREKLMATVERNRKLVADTIGDRAEDADRPVFNMAVVLSGLDLGAGLLREVFGQTFEGNFETLRNSLLSNTETLVPRNMSEASRVLDTFAFLSWINDEHDKDKLDFGKDYTINTGRKGEAVVEIRIKSTYTKYIRHVRSLGSSPLFDTVEGFITAMANYGGLTDSRCTGSVLKESHSTLVYQFSTEYLGKEGVAEFCTPR